MPYSFLEFKKWLDNNPTRRPANINDTVLNLWSNELTWTKLLCSKNPLIKEWLTEQGVKKRDLTLIHWNYYQLKIKKKQNDWQKQVKELEKNLDELRVLRVLKEFINPLFDPQNKPFIFIQKQIQNNETLREHFGNYYQFGVVATWKVENKKLVLKSIRSGQATEHILEKLTNNPYYLGNLALTKNEPVTNPN